MEVKLLNVSKMPVEIATLSAKTCVSKDIPELYACTNAKPLQRALESGHESVIEHITLTFAVSGISRACSHQLVRHRLASYTQQSQRYVCMDGFEYVVPDSVRKNDYDGCDYEWAMKVVRKVYLNLIAHGVPEEDARYVLPNAWKTNIIVTMNARELRHFFALRCCQRAQWEIRELAGRMLELAKAEVPIVFDDAGASCERLGYCPEHDSCGRHPRLPKLDGRSIG